jgi:hypothetical protein
MLDASGQLAKAHRDAQRKAQQQNQRAREISEERGAFTADEWLQLCARFAHKCVLCGHRRPLTPDHVIPLRSGGPNTISNIQPLCHACNIVKRKTAMDYRTDAMDPTRLSIGASDISRVADNLESAPSPIWRAKLVQIEGIIIERHRTESSPRGDVVPTSQLHELEIIRALIAEIRRLRKLLVANETLAHIESLAWWSRDSLPSALDAYLLDGKFNKALQPIAITNE